MYYINVWLRLTWHIKSIITVRKPAMKNAKHYKSVLHVVVILIIKKRSKCKKVKRKCDEKNYIFRFLESNTSFERNVNY